MKDGLIFENDELVYYKDDHLHHAGVIKVDGDIYYIGSKGRAVKGVHIVHRDMSNGILKRGTYTFGEDYKLVEGSYIAPKEDKHRKHKSHHSRHTRRHHRSHKEFHFSWKKAWIPCACIVLALGIGVSVFLLENKPHPQRDDITGSAGTSQSKLPTPNEEVLLCTLTAKREYDGQISLADAVYSGDPYRPFKFEYNLLSQDAVLFVAEDADLTAPRVFDLPRSTNYILIDNLKTDTTYYYKLVTDSKEYEGSFRTAASTRFLSIPGLVNVRDIGGYVTQDGKTVKQGLLIRGVELDGLENAKYFVPEDQLDAVNRTFGFAYDFDLRSPTIYAGTYSSRLGIPHNFYNSPTYGEIFNRTKRDSLQKIFTDLANPQNYPLYMHCTWGADRTGTIVFLLQGILNVSEEDMLREYYMTGYVNPNFLENDGMDTVIQGLQSYAGDTLQEKIVTFLTTDIGITQEQIDSIREIYLTE